MGGDISKGIIRRLEEHIHVFSERSWIIPQSYRRHSKMGRNGDGDGVNTTEALDTSCDSKYMDREVKRYLTCVRVKRGFSTTTCTQQLSRT